MPALITWWRLDVEQLAPQAPADAVAVVGTDLLARLGEPHRSYHTTQHLVEMFWALEDLQEGGEIDDREGALARVAAWFHDAVYEPLGAPGANEAASAELADQNLPALGFSTEDTGAVRGLIDATVEHESASGTGLLATFSDADLWILSAPPDRFDAYCRQVREEYAAVPDADYAAGRAAILEPFVRRDAVYATATARRLWEDAARENLSRELTRLR